MGGRDHGSTVRTRLRDIEVFAGPLPEFAPDRAPAGPVHLFLSRLSDAVADGLRGPVTPRSAQDSAAGSLSRSATARAESLPARQSQYPTDTAARDHAPATSLALVAQAPSLVEPAWTLHTLAPAEVEFRQAAKSRLHTRLRHERADGHWERFPLWS